MSNNNFSVWDGSVASRFAGGSGTEGNPYRINTASQLAYLEKVFSDPEAYLEKISNDLEAEMNKYYGKHYKLTSNIDLNNQEWQPIGDDTRTPDADYGNLAIHFDGDNHIIRGLYIERPDESNQGLFGNVHILSSFKNIIIEDAYVSGNTNVGGLIGNFASDMNDGGIKNCHFSGEVRGCKYVGGIVGKGYGIYLSNCTSCGKITCDNTGGGISGEFTGRPCEITNCINYGTITGYERIGGINGFSNNNITFKFCQNHGEIKITGTTAVNGGGITSQDGKFEYCINSGMVIGSGGIVGTSSHGYLKNCYNSGTIKGVRGSTGGLTGHATGMNFEFCTNTGNVNGKGYRTGGICGFCTSPYITTITFCRNEGKITDVKDSWEVGGIAGGYSFNISNCYNLGEVNGYSTIGGICGQAINCSNCINDGVITASNNVGGITGIVTGDIQDCINTGFVNSTNDSIGGIVGTCGTGVIKRCYNTGTVSGRQHLAGIIGTVMKEGTVVENCYSAGMIMANGNHARVGGIIGFVTGDGGKMINSHYFEDSALKAVGDVNKTMTFEYEESAVSFMDHEVVSSLLTQSIMKLAITIPVLFWSKKKEILLNQLSKLISISQSLGIDQDAKLLNEATGDDMYVVTEHALVREGVESNSNVISVCFKNEIVKIQPQMKRGSISNEMYDVFVGSKLGKISAKSLKKTSQVNALGAWEITSVGWLWKYPDSSYAKSRWEYINNHLYYFGPESYSYEGWKIIDGKQYYFNSGSINNLPYGALVTGWQKIDNINYLRSFDYYFDQEGVLRESPSDQFIVYGQDYGYDEINTHERSQEIANILNNKGFNGTINLDSKSSNVLELRNNTVPNSKTNLNTGVFIVNSHGFPGTMSFSDSYLSAIYRESKSVCLLGNEMNNVKMALFFGCLTGKLDHTGIQGDLLTQSITQGAKAAFGFNRIVLNTSNDRFSIELVKQLSLGKTLNEAAFLAERKVPEHDECRDYRILGGDTKLSYSLPMTFLKTHTIIPKDNTYKLHRESSGFKTYVKIIDGVMTSDYYTINKKGNVIDIRNKINNYNALNLKTKSNSKITQFSSVPNNVFDVYEIVDGKVCLLRIERTEIERGGFKYLDIRVEDLSTGKYIPYDKILDSYK